MYHTTRATHYKTAKDIISNDFVQYYAQYNIRFTIRDKVINETICYKPDKSVPPEDKYKNLPACNRYIPNKLIEFEAEGQRYRVDKDFNLYTEDNSAYYRTIKRGRIQYLVYQYDNNNMSAQTFAYELNKAIDKR